jgi:threonine dehydrogenase-like Zn-dependent dehydrogenase
LSLELRSHSRPVYSMVNVEQLNELMHNRQVLFLSDTLCTGYFAADMAEVRLGDDVAVFGAGPVGCSLV